MVKVLKCFSVNINGRAVLNTDAAGEGHLTCMNGMRYVMMNFTRHYLSNFINLNMKNSTTINTSFYHCYICRSITMIWVALGHFYLYGVAYAANTQIPIIIRNRGDCEQVSFIWITNSHCL